MTDVVVVASRYDSAAGQWVEVSREPVTVEVGLFDSKFEVQAVPVSGTYRVEVRTAEDIELYRSPAKVVSMGDRLTVTISAN